MKFDYSLEDAAERKRFVDGVLADTPDVTPKQLEYLADYLLFASDKGSTKSERDEEYPIVTKNREVTVSKRQVSYDAMDEGDEGVWPSTVGRVQLLDPKDPITDTDVEEVPGLRAKLDVAKSLREAVDAAKGEQKVALRRQLISTYQECYAIKLSHVGYGAAQPAKMAVVETLPDEDVWVDSDGYPHPKPGSVSFMDPKQVSAFLSSYVAVRSQADGALDSDVKLMAMDLGRLLKKALLPDEPLLYDVAVMRMCGCSNDEVASAMRAKYGTTHLHNYYSTLWRRRIPSMIARTVQEEYVMRHHDEMGFTRYKVCSRCGRKKLAHLMFFGRNSSADGFYSICKKCRSKEKSLAVDLKG